MPTDLLHEAAERVRVDTADVVIPTKSNPSVKSLAHSLVNDPAVGKVIVIGDGPDATDLSGLWVEKGKGIHAMWNIGLRLLAPNRHVLFLNDDVTVTHTTVSDLVATMNECPELGLVCPNYSGETIDGPYRAVTETCRGRYDGTGGLGGFAMMLRSDLARRWRFDERMRWWYGDDDLLNWVWHEGWVAGISARSTCTDNASWTIVNDPPEDFASVVENDRKVFMSKWGNGAS